MSRWDQGLSETSGDSGQRSVQSVEVGGRLLLVLASNRAPMTLKDLAAQAGLAPARAHPYLVSFSRLGFVQQDTVSGRYALGPAALQMGLACLHQLDPVRIAEPIAERLAEETGFAVGLALWGNFGPTIVRMIEARQPLLVAMRAGTVMSIFGTATGRAFVGALREDRVAQAKAGPLGDGLATSKALTDEEKAIAAQARADLQAHGVVRAQGRPIPGVHAFSAPALGHDGTPMIVITALGHQDYFPVDWDSAAAKAVKEAAREVTRRLGGSALLGD